MFVEGTKIILHKDFWQRLEDLCDIFEPLHIMQKASEAANANIMEVAERWLELHKIMPRKAAYTEFFAEINDYFTGSDFMHRLEMQILPIHRLAYYLHPARIHEEIDARYYAGISSILEAQKSKDGAPSAWEDFLAFRQQSGVFGHTLCWEQQTYISFGQKQ